MCGRYGLGIRVSFVRHRMRELGMQVDDDLNDDDVRETYNFAPGYRGIVYRPDTPASGAQSQHREVANDGSREADSASHRTDEGDEADRDAPEGTSIGKPLSDKATEPQFRLQSMQWGLIPFWTKRDPGYGSMMKTINCRDDSLAQKGGMWNTMKKNKRCIVVAQGFYEWLKKDGGRIKIPHFIKRSDGDLMYFAGLWDCVQYEASDQQLWTYTIITTEVNQQLSFLHDRMPVIFDPNSAAMKTWLDPSRTEWSQELQSLLEPYPGKLEFYPVDQAVGKVGNNSPNFIVPVDSSENKRNIANFFGNARTVKDHKTIPDRQVDQRKKPKLESEIDSSRTAEGNRTEDNAPMPAPEKKSLDKHSRENESDQHEEQASKRIKVEDKVSPSKARTQTSPLKTSARKMRDATSNNTSEKVKTKSDGTMKITSFFAK